MIATPETVLRLAWAAWLLSWLAASVWRAPAAARLDRGRETSYRLLTVAGALLLFVLNPQRVPWVARTWQLPPSAQWTLVALAISGFAFSWWARLYLGRLWSSGVTRKADHHVVETGPYGWVRHPIYTGLIVATVSTAAMFGTVPAWAGAVLLIAAWYVKARLEEDFLRAELGAEAYGAYARRVPMLVPFLWY